LPNGIVPNKSIRMQPGDTLYYNGVPVTSGTGGGGIAASDNIAFSGRVTTSDLWTFNDSAKFTRIVNMDSLRVSGTTYHGTTKTLTAASVNYNLENGFEWQNRNTYQLMTLDSANGLIIRKKFNSVNDSLTTDSKFYFNDTVKFAAYTEITGNAQVSGNLNVGTNIVTTGNITADSIAGIGAFITDVNANTLKGQDTTKFARTDTLTTEGIKGIWNFWNTVRFYTTVTFDVTPVFNAVVNFANGINVTGTATFNSDVIFTGWQKVGASSNIDKYTRDTIIRFVLPNSTGGGTYANHGIADWRSIRKWNAVILEDSTNRLFTPMTYYAPYAYYAFVESTRVYIETLAGSYPFKNDTAIFYITVADINR